MVSKANVDFPEPERPVMTVNLFRGISTCRFLRLCSLAPLRMMELSIRIFLGKGVIKVAEGKL